MATPRRLLAVLTALGTVAAGAPAAASAALPWAPCSPTGFECATLDVPLDGSGAVPGAITLSATRVVSAANPGRVAMVALAGGPGQAALPLAEDFASVLGPAITSRDLLIFDQRGTGKSNPLTCAALRQRGTLTTTARKCADQLGAARAFFRTADSVDDLERLRVAGGYEKLALYGVSYGTKVATAYAAAHPDRVDSIVLDSVTTPEGPDAFRRSSLQAVPRVTRQICAQKRCRGITTSAATDLAHLAARLRKRSLRGSVFSSSGRAFTARLSEDGLFGILLAGDLNPTLRAELPGSVRAALAGDTKPILRLSARSAGLQNSARPRTPVGLQSATADSDALFLDTTCEENMTFPWARGASLKERKRATVAALNALPAGATGPFSRAVALAGGYVPFCLGWPEASPPPVATGALPAVPALVIDGTSDVRTPLEDARAVAGRIPGAQVLAVPNVGHSVLGSDPTSCTSDAIKAFFGGRAVAQCAAAAPRFAPTPRPPTRVSRLKPYGHLKGRLGRTVEALRVTVNDAKSQVLGEALAIGASPAGAGGLRHGSVKVVRGGLRLRSYEYIPGVSVSGTLPARGTAVLTIRGRDASSGTVRVSSSLAVSGRLDGRRVSTKFGTTAASAAAQPFGGLTLAQAIARGKRIHSGL
jgi:pimeloyl-ACP methyl ester carboxylesterase